MLTTILLSILIRIGQLVAIITTASGVLLASAMAALGIVLFLMQFGLA
jgi:citrate lyase beta subunit